MKKILIAAAALSFAALALVLVAPWRSADPAPVAAARAATTRASGATGAGSVAAVEASRADAAPAAAEVRPAADRTRAASAGAAVRGRVVYEATGEGVPFLDLAVRDARGREDLVTDRDGEFATTRGFDADAEITAEGLRAPAGKDRVLFDGNFQRLPAGAVVLRPTDGSPPYLQWKDDGAGRTAAKVETWRRIDESGGAAAVRLAVALGPTYFVDGRLPAGCGVADVAVALGRRDDTDIMWLRQWSATAAPLREVPDRSGRYWCRPRATTRVGADDAALFVATADGLWRGTAPVRETIGVQDEPVVIAFTGAGVVTGVVTDSQGQACGGLWVTIVRTAESRVDQTSSRTDEQGRYRIANVIPGPARLEVAGERTEPWRQGIDVIAGREVRRDIVLAARRIGGAIAGTITTDSGARFPMCSVILTSHDDATLWRTARIEWQEVDGRQQASWSFADVPAIACDVTLETFEPCGVAAPHFRVVAPAEGVAFRVHDALPRQQAVVRVVDDGGRELGGWSLFLRGDAGWQMRLDQKEPGAHRVELPIGASFVWRVAGDGIRTRSGTATPAPDAPLELLVATTPGFSTLLTCMDIANFYAARGVEVFADDAPVGATDEQGDLWLDLAKRPNALRLDPAAWRIFHDSSHRSDVDAATGGFTHRDAGARLHLYVQRVY